MDKTKKVSGPLTSSSKIELLTKCEVTPVNKMLQEFQRPRTRAKSGKSSMRLSNQNPFIK
jgi:hypothetical protein